MKTSWKQKKEIPYRSTHTTIPLLISPTVDHPPIPRSTFFKKNISFSFSLVGMCGGKSLSSNLLIRVIFILSSRQWQMAEGRGRKRNRKTFLFSAKKEGKRQAVEIPNWRRRTLPVKIFLVELKRKLANLFLGLSLLILRSFREN